MINFCSENTGDVLLNYINFYLNVEVLMKRVIFSQRAYLSMLAEVYERIETETGGILLGHREGDNWYVVESVEPGPKSIFTPTYFEYDDEYVTYRANKLSRLYASSIELLGLWHRHPGLMKTFSSTDDGTNKIYSDMLSGAISGIVTLENGFDITMYFVPSNMRYEKIEWVIDDEQIPKKYMIYYDTKYYKKLIDEKSKESSGLKNKNFKNQSIYQDDEFQSFGRIREQKQFHNQGSDHPRRRFISAFAEWIVDRISDIFEDLNENDAIDDFRYTPVNENKDNSDIVLIFDTIESEIAYLQQLETMGEVRSTIESKRDNKGKEGLVLIVEDMRQVERYYYKFTFFISKRRVMVKDENGKVRPYTNNSISMILGG